MTTESDTLKALLKSLEHPHLKHIDLSLGRIERHLAAIGNPQLRVPPVIHVAGTNGKGSSIAFMRAILRAAGYRCHVFTSPHLVHFCERFVVADHMATEDEIINELQEIVALSQSFPLTFFEANAVAAFKLFAKHPADFTLLEVGMGGRFDATNVHPAPALTAITPISMDHESFLGDTLAKIAYEKAGIIKTGVPVVVAPQAPEAAEVIERVAKERQAPIYWVETKSYDHLGLKGAHQHINASLAEIAINALKNNNLFQKNQTDIQQGLSQAIWPGRLQQLTSGELVNEAPSNTQIWIDGGHNAAAGNMLAQWASQQSAPVHLVCAMTQLKDATAFLQPLAKQVASITVTDIPNEPLSMPQETLHNLSQKLHNNLSSCKTALEAIKQMPPNAIVLFTGSLYFVGSILEKNR